jgi:UDP-N-acetylmuramate dehydrogenase
VADEAGLEQEVAAEDLALGYDASRLQHSGEAVLWAEFAVGEGDVSALRAIARESLAYRKRTQPLAAPSAGCIFQNPDAARDNLPAGVPASAGALIDRAGLKGRTVGGATVSTLHGNFIVSNGRATASDVRRLITICRQKVEQDLGVVLRDEIVYLGEFASRTS